jgi:hypothetical protein
MTVTGTIDDIYSEADGDYHIRLLVDTQYNYLLNADNISSEYGCLVCEPICAASPITQSDAVAPCAGLVSTVFLPNIGEYVAITGPYVTDNDHGWNELHPVTNIVITHPTTGITKPAALPDLKVYPQPAAEVLNFDFETPPHVQTYIDIYSIEGREVGAYMLSETCNFVLHTGYYPTGDYTYTISQGQGILRKGKFTIVH